MGQFPLDTTWTFNYVRLACISECYVAIAIRDRSTKTLCGNGEDTAPAAIEWLAAAGYQPPLAITCP